jgi:hypothetical protein
MRPHIRKKQTHDNASITCVKTCLPMFGKTKITFRTQIVTRRLLRMGVDTVGSCTKAERLESKAGCRSQGGYSRSFRGMCESRKRLENMRQTEMWILAFVGTFTDIVKIYIMFKSLSRLCFTIIRYLGRATWIVSMDDMSLDFLHCVAPVPA